MRYIPGAPRDGNWTGVAWLGGGGSSQPSSTTTTQKTEPWSGQQPYLTDVYQKAQDAYNASSQTPYSGQYVASPTAAQTQAVQNRIDQSGSLAGLGNSTIALAQDSLSGKYLDGSQNPYLQSSVQAAINPVLDAYKTQVLPGISSSASSQGAYGGARHGLALAQSAQDVNQQMTDIAAKIGYENYAAERSNQMNAASLLQTGVGLNDLQNQYLEGSGNTQQTWNQNTLDELYQQWQAQQAAPWTGLSDYAGVILNGSPGSATSGTANYAGNNSRASSAISGGMSGAALGGLGAYATLGAANMWNPLGWAMTGGGALLGGLSGGLK